MKHKRVVEQLNHFQCGKCRKWWSIGDAPKEKKKWFCPWCGIANEVDVTVKKSLKKKSSK
jgi:ribosomal protein S27AE